MTDHQGCEETKKICVEIEQNLLKIKTTEIDACRLRIEDYQLREKLYNAYEFGRKENIWGNSYVTRISTSPTTPPATDISKEYRPSFLSRILLRTVPTLINVYYTKRILFTRRLAKLPHLSSVLIAIIGRTLLGLLPLAAFLLLD